ncbi:bifunctional nuclease family protein [Natronoglycomyces albus]|uniref:Bifunctional nuclease family protein n=1 Tax=Natronoglycomyces albus TaxID=2811108 RepID=A0A895XNA3_9ACTN|nr:bifunctional nuclease family protein [Natronoglycomyces albus]QSB06834.1 bifunctional nuclease family protein [Natronoglycomyces albus]
MRELKMVGVRVELPTNQPVVLLKEVEGERYLPIWIGTVEAAAIHYKQQNVQITRPLTHDLMRDILVELGVELTAVELVELRDTTFYADLVLDNDTRVSARPSDAIALALRTGTKVWCAEEVLDEAGISLPDKQEDEVEKFREFLDEVSPDDFA